MRTTGLWAVLSCALVLAPPGRAYAAGPVDPNIAITITTRNLSDALSTGPEIQWSALPSGLPVISVNPAVRYQRLKGFGGAMTDSSAWLIWDNLPAAARQTLLSDLFTPSGIDLGFLRVPIAASDFTVHGKPYSYDESHEPDPSLRHFTIAHDRPYVIPAIKAALALNPGMFTIATPWSPPAWMKSNDSLENPMDSGAVEASDLPALADYFVKFLQAYRQQGIPLAAVTPQNEPTNPTEYPGADLPASMEATFIAKDLAPALARAHLDTRIYDYDFGWSSVSLPYARYLERSSAVGRMAGLATHCYFGSPTAMSELHAKVPRLDEIVSECSPGIIPFTTSELLIGSLRNWATAVGLWNLALDPRGGPVQPPNSGCHTCTGLVTIDERTHSVTFSRDYYQLGQFSRFIEPGAVRIGSNSFTSYRYFGRGVDFARPALDDVAFENPDGSEVLVVYDDGPTDAGFDLHAGGRYASYVLSPWGDGDPGVGSSVIRANQHLHPAAPGSACGGSPSRVLRPGRVN